MPTASLPTIHLDPPGGLLARWLRLAGFPVRVSDSPAPPLSSSSGESFRRLRLEGPGVPEGRESVVVPEAPWPEQLGELARTLGLSPADLRPATRCPRCGGALGYVEREDLAGRLPRGAPAGTRHFLSCDACGRMSWPGPATRDHTRQLRAVLMEHAFRCGRCGEEARDAGDRHLARVEVLTRAGPVVIPEEEFTRDPSAEIAAILRRLEHVGEQELLDAVAFHREQPLCTPCKRALTKLLQDFFRDPA